MPRTLYLLWLLALLGCGPTPQERYNTAQQILTREIKDMALVELAFEDAVELVKDRVCFLRTGVNAKAVLQEVKARRAELQALDDRPDGFLNALRNLNDLTTLDKKGMPLKDKYDAFMALAEMAGTPEHAAVQSALAATPEAKALDAQKLRLRRAKVFLDEAEARLPR